MSIKRPVCHAYKQCMRQTGQYIHYPIVEMCEQLVAGWAQHLVEEAEQQEGGGPLSNKNAPVALVECEQAGGDDD